MLDTLDDRIFADLHDAYGPAVDVPDRLRAIAGDDLESAQRALGDLAAGIFHQGSYFSSTAPTIPFLLELAGAAIPARADVLLLLADMSGAPVDPELAYQPYLFQSMPGPPDYPEAIATVDALRAGRSIFVAALDAADARTRACAAYLLAGLGDAAMVEPLARTLARESDANARITLHFGLARLGARPQTQESGPVADVVDALRIDSDRERGFAAIGRLLLCARLARERMPFFGGDLVRFAAVILTEHGDDPRAFTVAEQALAERLARGEVIRQLPRPPSTRLCDEPSDAWTSSYDEYLADVPLRSIAGAMASLAFGERARDPRLLLREQLDDRMRRVLALTRDHAIPVPVAGAPWIDAEHMARFLAGGGPLDATIEWRGETLPLFAVLSSIARADDRDAAREAADRLFAELAQRWSHAQMLELAIDILDDGYNLAAPESPLPGLRAALLERIDLLAPDLAEPLAAYAERLLARENLYGEQARLALAPAIAAREPVEPRFDRLARSAMAIDRPTGLAWLASFPEPRRSRMVAAWGNAWLYAQFGAVCDPATLEVAVIEAFLDPACAWFEHDAESLLQKVADTARLEALRAEVVGRRARVLDRVIRSRTREGVFVLDMQIDGDAIRATLRDGGGRSITQATISSSPRVDELAALVEQLDNAAETTLELEGNASSTTLYRVMRLLRDAGFRGRSCSGGTTMQ